MATSDAYDGNSEFPFPDMGNPTVAVPSDQDVEVVILTALREEIATIRTHYLTSHGRIRKDMVQRLKDLVRLRREDLKQWDAPAPGDTANIAIYEATKKFTSRLKKIVKRIDSAYRKTTRVPASLVNELEALVEARVLAEAQE